MKILLIADDLTGALDASVAFAARGLSVVCASTPDATGRAIDLAPDVLAVSTNSRDLSEDDAVARLKAVMERARSVPNWDEVVLFKKVDSRLKGHIAAEMALLAAYRRDALVCPAIPRLGRFVRDGAVCGSGVAEPIPVVGRVGATAARAPDAERQEDLDAAVAGVSLDTLFVGAAGLAEALAQRMLPDIRHLITSDATFPALFAIGSRDPLTLAQLDGFDTIAAPNGIVPSPLADCTPMQLVQMTAVAAQSTPEIAARTFAQGISASLTQQRPSTLLACGGEIATAILSAVGCSLVRVEGEILPGLPVSRMLDGIPGLTLITKSGGFGTPDTLHHVVRKLSAGTE